jgi:ornithine--oxo-acid transaminase
MIESDLSSDLIALMEGHSAHNYHPLPVVIAEGQGAWVTDVDGKRYLDMVAAYSALNFGHRHPALVRAAVEQLERLTLTSRAFHNDQLPRWCQELAELCGKDMVLPMNTGAEAIETAIKTARKWNAEVKGVDPERARILVAEGNFHGRTTTIVGFSTDPHARQGFGPFTPGFEVVPYGDAAALEAAFDDEIIALLVEPIQGEAGVIVPPDGYLRQAREICSRHGALFIADEIQSGLGRTGATFACEHEQVVPDVYVLGKALAGGITPLSAVVANADILGVIRPGQHGSTFGGNPLACAVGLEVLKLLRTGEFQAHSAELGSWLIGELRAADVAHLKEVRGRGLWLGIEVTPGSRDARWVCERLMAEGVLAKDTHDTTIRLAPPLVVTRRDLEWALERIVAALEAAAP